MVVGISVVAGGGRGSVCNVDRIGVIGCVCVCRGSWLWWFSLCVGVYFACVCLSGDARVGGGG